MITKCRLQHLNANVILFKQINGFILNVKTIRNITAREKSKIKQKMFYFQ